MNYFNQALRETTLAIQKKNSSGIFPVGDAPETHEQTENPTKTTNPESSDGGF
jgi:hypothetical protein